MLLYVKCFFVITFIVCIFSYFHTCGLTSLFFIPVLTESSSGYVPFQAKSALKALESVQKQELDFDPLSEEQVRIGSPSPPLHSTGTPSSTSSPVHQQSSSQDSSTGAAKISRPPANGVQQYLERAKAAATAASVVQHHRPAPKMGSDQPPALPPKTRKAKMSEAPKVSEHSDRGDSDMDEESFFGSQEKLKVKKVWPLCLCDSFFYMSSYVIVVYTRKKVFLSFYPNSFSTNKHYTLPLEMLGTTNCLL